MNHIAKIILCLLFAAFLVGTVSAFDENTEGKLTINSVPDGAEVWLAGEFIGYTPVTDIVRADGAINLRIDKIPGNYQSWRGSVYVPAGQSVSFAANLYSTTEPAKDTGIIIVSSTVEGAEVYMDNSFAGYITNGAYHIDNAKLGLHYIVVKKEGYHDFSSMAEVNPKNKATTNIIAEMVSINSAEPVTTGHTSSVPTSPTKAAAFGLFPLAALLFAAVIRK